MVTIETQLRKPGVSRSRRARNYVCNELLLLTNPHHEPLLAVAIEGTVHE
jgi:hypothetical protein